MKRIIPTLLLGGGFVLLLSGCIAPPSAEFAPPEGILFNNYKAPLLVDYDNTKVRGYAGEASCGAFHDIILTGMSFAWGDCSVDEATHAGRLSRIGAADYEYLGFLGIYGKTTVHVYEAPSVAVNSGRKPVVAAPAAGTASVKEKLEKLNALKESGLLTNDEYQVKRQAILNAL